jgi:hypothetical protein
MTARIRTMLSLGLLIAGAGSVHAGTWNALPPLAPGRYSAAPAATADAFYLFGGANLSGNYAGATAWDAGSNAWADVTTLPAARAFAGAAALQTSVLLAGGFEDSGFPSTLVRRFDPASNTWSNAASLPSGQAAMGCVSLGGSTYVAGGETDYGALSAQCLRYDPVANAWSAIAALPTPRTGPGSAVLNGRFFVIGGASGAPSAAVEAYDPAANAWSASTPLPEALWLPAATTFSGRIWVIGGFDASYYPSRHVYSAGSDGVWRAEASLPQPLAQSAAGVLGNELFVAGGVDSLGMPTGAAFSMAADVQPPPAETLHVAVTINPATLNVASNGNWITVILQSDWPIADLDLATLSLGGIAVDTSAPLAINQGEFVVEVKFPRGPFTQLSSGHHALELEGLTVNGVPVSGVGSLNVIGIGNAKAKLAPRRPSPGSAEIAVTLVEPMQISLDVVDIQGRVLDRIESDFHPAGTFSVTWPSGGRKVQSGLYFMRLRAPGATAMTKMVVSR